MNDRGEQQYIELNEFIAMFGKDLEVCLSIASCFLNNTMNMVVMYSSMYLILCEF